MFLVIYATDNNTLKILDMLCSLHINFFLALCVLVFVKFSTSTYINNIKWIRYHDFLWKCIVSWIWTHFETASYISRTKFISILTGPGVRRSKHPMSACHTRRKCSMEPTQNSVKGRVRYKVWSVGGCHCIWSGHRMSFNICERETSYCLIDPRIDHKTSSTTISSVPWRIPVREVYLKVASPSG